MPINTSLLNICKDCSQENLLILQNSSYSFEEINAIDEATGLRPIHFILQAPIADASRFAYLEALLLQQADPRLTTLAGVTVTSLIEKLPKKIKYILQN